MRNLHDYQLRLLNNATSPPSGNDVANTLKYFSQTLLGIDSSIFFLLTPLAHVHALFTGILRDVPDFPLLMIYNKERDAKRMALFPSLDYRGLYAVLVQLLEVTPLIQSGTDGNYIIIKFTFKVRNK